MEEYVIFLKTCRTHLTEIIAQFDSRQFDQAKSLLLGYMEEMQLLFATWEENGILSKEQTMQLSGDLLKGIKNEDIVYLRDVIKYGVIDVINQLVGEENGDA